MNVTVMNVTIKIDLKVAINYIRELVQHILSIVNFLWLCVP